MEIKMCPFCGNKAALYCRENAYTGQYYALCQCTVCGAKGKTFTVEGTGELEEKAACTRAVEVWNIRQGDRTYEYADAVADAIMERLTVAGKIVKLR